VSFLHPRRWHQPPPPIAITPPCAPPPPPQASHRPADPEGTTAAVLRAFRDGAFSPSACRPNNRSPPTQTHIEWLPVLLIFHKAYWTKPGG